MPEPSTEVGSDVEVPDSEGGVACPTSLGVLFLEGVEPDSPPAVSRLSEAIGGRTRIIQGPDAVRAILERIPALFGVEIGAVLARGWRRAEELHGYADPDRYPPGETILVELARHTVRSRHEPHLEIVLNGATVGRIDFQLDLSLEIEAALLTIRDGHIREAAPGVCLASGELKCEGHTIVRREAEPLPLPGRLVLETPIPLRSGID